MNRSTVQVIWLVFSAACAPAVMAQAQPREPLIGVLYHGNESSGGSRVGSLREGLRELGYVDGRNCRIEVRWSENQIDRLPILAKHLVALKPDILVASLVRPAEALNRETKSLKGTKPGDLPIERPTRFELVVNQHAAKTIGIRLPESIPLRTDRVIE